MQLLLHSYCTGTHPDSSDWLHGFHMWHDQGEWVTCWQYSIFIFEYKSLVHLKCYILIQIPSQSDIWLQRYEQFFKFKNNVKHTNLSPLLACNSKSIFSTSDSFPVIMSHIITQYRCGYCMFEYRSQQLQSTLIVPPMGTQPDSSWLAT